MDVLDEYVSAVKSAIWAVDNGSDAAREIEMLQPLEIRLRQWISSLDSQPAYLKAITIHKASALFKRENQPFLLVYNGGHNEQVIGWENLAKRIRLCQGSIRAYLSKGKGKFDIYRRNPLTNEPDLLTVTRVRAANEPAKPKIGRPRTRPLTEQEYLTSTGQATEFTGKQHAKDLAR